ncbi:MAG: resolvase [Candidatus Wallbacteria bacterium]|nr:resolvase [Candidatus Wallbacteria bacterium]
MAEDGADRGRRIVKRPELVEAVGALLAAQAIERLILGDGTQSRAVASELTSGLGARLPPMERIDERDSTLDARGLYFADNPPRGIWRLFPLSMQVPGEPYDDYAALVLARRWLRGRKG